MDLQDLISRAEIHEVLMRYCRGVDRLDKKLIQSVYHEGAHDSHGGFEGTGEEFAEYCLRVSEPIPESVVGQHHITNVSINLKGDAADVESYFIAFQPYEKNDTPNYDLAVMGGRYLDKFEKRDERWAIVKRYVVMDWSRESIPGSQYEVVASNYEAGRRRDNDPSVAFFAGD